MGSKSSKRNSTVIEPLDRQTLEELCHDTGFTEEELNAWHTNFYKDCPDGKLTLKQFEHHYAKIMGKPTQKTANYVRHMFNVYDQDKNQYIDFREFVVALSAASVVNRLRLVETLFHVFDLDNDGKITKEEISKMLHTLADVTNTTDKRRSRRSQHNASQQEQNKQLDIQKRIDDAFNELNANDDDHITKDEFIDWYMKSGLISDVQTNDITATDPSRIPQIAKKSRKLKKQTSNMKTTTDPEDIRHPTSFLVRHMSRMTERKSPTRHHDDDNDNDGDEIVVDDDDRRVSHSRTHRRTTDENHYADSDHEHNGDIHPIPMRSRPNIVISTDSNSTDRPFTQENERWQYLFNSVLGQIRSQREREQNTQPLTTSQINNQPGPSQRWKRSGKSDTLEMRQIDDAPNGQTNPSFLSTSRTDFDSSDDNSSSPDIITVRL